MKYIINTYKEDEDLSLLCAAQILKNEPDARIVYLNDAERPANETKLAQMGEVRFRKAPSGGNLNGLAFVVEELSFFASENEPVVKIDADIFLRSGDWLQTTPEAEILWLERYDALIPSGGCYRIAPAAAQKILSLVEERLKSYGMQKAIYPEDITIFHLAAISGVSQRMIPYNTLTLCGFSENYLERVQRAKVIHCGEPVNGKMTRAHAYARMLYLSACAEKQKENTPEPCSPAN